MCVAIPDQDPTLWWMLCGGGARSLGKRTQCDLTSVLTDIKAAPSAVEKPCELEFTCKWNPISGRDQICAHSSSIPEIAIMRIGSNRLFPWGMSANHGFQTSSHFRRSKVGTWGIVRQWEQNLASIKASGTQSHAVASPPDRSQITAHPQGGQSQASAAKLSIWCSQYQVTHLQRAPQILWASPLSLLWPASLTKSHAIKGVAWTLNTASSKSLRRSKDCTSSRQLLSPNGMLLGQCALGTDRPILNRQRHSSLNSPYLHPDHTIYRQCVDLNLTM